jgi:hypothetical protein
MKDISNQASIYGTRIKTPDLYKKMSKKQSSPCKITPRTSMIDDISPVSGLKTSNTKKSRSSSNNAISTNKNDKIIINKRISVKNEYKNRIIEKEFLLGTRNKLSVKKSI